jgi:hypothetical protein
LVLLLLLPLVFLCVAAMTLQFSKKNHLDTLPNNNSTFSLSLSLKLPLSSLSLSSSPSLSEEFEWHANEILSALQYH